LSAWKNIQTIYFTLYGVFAALVILKPFVEKDFKTIFCNSFIYSGGLESLIIPISKAIFLGIQIFLLSLCTYLMLFYWLNPRLKTTVSYLKISYLTLFSILPMVVYYFSLVLLYSVIFLLNPIGLEQFLPYIRNATYYVCGYIFVLCIFSAIRIRKKNN